DVAREEGLAAAIAASEAEEQQRALAAAVAKAEAEARAEAQSRVEQAVRDEQAQAIEKIVPIVSTIGATVRVTFPFEDDTAAAVFRRGDIIWMLFDTPLEIDAPEQA